MNISKFKVFITKYGDGAITYTQNKKEYKVLLSRKDIIIRDIFDKYFNQLKEFKYRYYAISKWIARDVRDRGYVFKSYTNNPNNIRPILKKKKPLEFYSKQHLYEFHYRKHRSVVSDMERLIHGSFRKC